MTGTSPVTGWFRDPELRKHRRQTAKAEAKPESDAVVFLRAREGKFSFCAPARGNFLCRLLSVINFGGAEMRSSGRGLSGIPVTPY
jgi:hypothetical protein